MALARVIQPFPTAPFPDYVRDSALDAAVKRIAAQFTQLAVGLIDLTPPKPTVGFPYGGSSNDDTNINIGSGAKVAAMFPAFQLREAVADALTGLTPASGDTEQSLLIELSRQLQPLSGSPYWQRFGQDVPNLGKIVRILPNANQTGWNTVFVSKTQDLSSFDFDQPNHQNARAIDPLGFYERMQLMIANSDNCGAMTCIVDLGFQYINGVLSRAGFFDNVKNSGLWLGAAYAKGCINQRVHVWEQVPGGRFANDSGFQVSSARMLAKLMGIIAEGRGVNAISSAGMLLLMDKQSPPHGLSGARSFLGEALSGKRNLSVCSKIGIADFRSDAAIIERPSASGTMLKYVAVALKAPDSATGDNMLHGVSRQLDALVESRHP